jgi:hypothetical protein
MASTASSVDTTSSNVDTSPDAFSSKNVRRAPAIASDSRMAPPSVGTSRRVSHEDMFLADGGARLSPFALLAQSVEHLHGKEGVDGSSPSEGFS